MAGVAHPAVARIRAWHGELTAIRQALHEYVDKNPASGPVDLEIAQVGVDTETPNRIVNDPSHPDADPETGLLEMPNVDLVQEMTDLTSANRSYQANVTVLNAVKQMALRALDITSR